MRMSTVGSWTRRSGTGKKLSACGRRIHWPTKAEATPDSRKAIGKADSPIWMKLLQLDPKYVDGLSSRAFVRAGCPDEKFRDAKQALVDSRKACELTEWKAPNPLEAYAAACSEAGNFAEAVKWQKKVLEFEDYMVERGLDVRKRLKLYEAKMPYREPSMTPP